MIEDQAVEGAIFRSKELWIKLEEKLTKYLPAWK